MSKKVDLVSPESHQFSDQPLKSTAQLFCKVKSDHLSRPARLGFKNIAISAAGAEKTVFYTTYSTLPEKNEPTT